MIIQETLNYSDGIGILGEISFQEGGEMWFRLDKGSLISETQLEHVMKNIKRLKKITQSRDSTHLEGKE